MCANCISDESKILKQKRNKKVVEITLILLIIKHVDIFFKVQKRHR